MKKEELKLSYAEAMEQIEQILESISDDSLDVDALGERVERATQLIALCKSKLTKASQQIDKVLEAKKE